MANPGEITLRKAHGRAKELETARWWNTDGEVPLNLCLHFCRLGETIKSTERRLVLSVIF